MGTETRRRSIVHCSYIGLPDPLRYSELGTGFSPCRYLPEPLRLQPSGATVAGWDSRPVSSSAVPGRTRRSGSGPAGAFEGSRRSVHSLWTISGDAVVALPGQFPVLLRRGLDITTAASAMTRPVRCDPSAPSRHRARSGRGQLPGIGAVSGGLSFSRWRGLQVTAVRACGSRPRAR